MNDDGCDAWFELTPRVAVPPLRTFFRLPKGAVGVFEVEQVGNFPITSAIEMVREDMKANAMVLIK